jgi:RimJ/RimL family protein N-acetyltransferase
MSAFPPLVTARLALVPLAAAHADEAFDAFADPALYRYMPGTPPEDRGALRARFGQLAAGSGRADEVWANWLARRRGDGALVGWHQATLTAPSASIAWVTFGAHRREGYAREGAAAVVAWLRSAGAREIVAQSDERNLASGRTALALGFVPDPDPVPEELRGEATLDRVYRLGRAPG